MISCTLVFHSENEFWISGSFAICKPVMIRVKAVVKLCGCSSKSIKQCAAVMIVHWVIIDPPQKCLQDPRLEKDKAKGTLAPKRGWRYITQGPHPPTGPTHGVTPPPGKFLAEDYRLINFFHWNLNLFKTVLLLILHLPLLGLTRSVARSHLRSII